jgi:hypothetical protein
MTKLKNKTVTSMNLAIFILVTKKKNQNVEKGAQAYTKGKERCYNLL